MGVFPIVGQEIKTTDDGSKPEGGRSFQGRAAVITLGCAKNHVDSEVMLGVLRESGYEVVPDVQDADVAVVNTCGFLQSALKESIDCVLEVADLKSNGRLRKLIVTGCAVSRFRAGGGESGGRDADIQRALPEVDCFLSTDEILSIGQAAGAQHREALTGLLAEASRPYFLYDDSMPRQLATRPHYAYVKISEGCNRPCTFCIIPHIRGPLRSRDIDSVVREVETLGAQGVREVNLVAQDLTSYGIDHEGQRGSQLISLLKQLDAASAVEWIRLLYAYPVGCGPELLKTIQDLPRVCNYLDIPLQHASEKVLARMKRPLGRYAPRALVEMMRSVAPLVAIRTTFIVGFPGETDADVDELEQFILEGHFSSVGIFTYSKEDGTPAFDLDGHISEKEKNKRRDRLMKAQQRVNAMRLQSMVGTVIPVLVEGPHEESAMLLTGRAPFQAPEVDGAIIINDVDESIAGSIAGHIVQAEVTEVMGYDVVARVVSCQPRPLVQRSVMTSQEGADVHA